MTSDFHIVLIHGLNSYGATWRFMASHLAEQITGQPDFVELSLTAEFQSQRNKRPAPFGPSSHSLSDLWTLRDTFFRDVLETQKKTYGYCAADYKTVTLYKRLAHVVSHNSRTKMYIRFTSPITQFDDSIETIRNKRVFAVNFSHKNELTFDAQAYELQQFLSAIHEATGLGRFVLIGHSMGGLALRAFFQYQKPTHPELEILSCFCINTPHEGSKIAADIRDGINTKTVSFAQKIAQTQYKEMIQKSIQNSGLQLSKKMIEHKKAYSGDFLTFAFGKHAGFNLFPDSQSLQDLAHEEQTHPERYDTKTQWHFIGSAAQNGWGLFDLSDGLVPLSSQMGYNIVGLNPRRAIFVHGVKTLEAFDDFPSDEKHILSPSLTMKLLFSPNVPIVQHLIIHAEPDVIDYVSRHCRAREK